MVTINRSESEVTVFESRRVSKCAKCGSAIARGEHIVLNPDRTAQCAKCVGLANLVFLPRGDTALTRRATMYSKHHAEVLRFSARRMRCERQGILVEAEAIKRAEEENLRDADRREKQREKAAARREKKDAEYRKEFAQAIQRHYPKCPPDEASGIAGHACEKYSGRVGRSAAAKELSESAITLAVRAHIRHSHTEYDSIIQLLDKEDARNAVRSRIDSIESVWRGSRRSKSL